MRKKVMKCILILKIIDHIRSVMFFFAFTKPFLDVSQTGYNNNVKGLKGYLALLCAIYRCV